MKRRQIIIYIIISLIIFAGLAAFILNKYFKVFADSPSLPTPTSNSQWVFSTTLSNTQGTLSHQYKGKVFNYPVLYSGINVVYLSKTLCQNCTIAKLNASDYGMANFPVLAVVIDADLKINSSYIFNPDGSLRAIVNPTNSGQAMGGLLTLNEFGRTPSNTPKIDALKNDTNGWYAYYQYILGLSNIQIIQNTGDGTDTNTVLPDSVKQSCSSNLVSAPPTTQTSPEIKAAFDNIKQRIPSYDPATIMGGQDNLNSYVSSVNESFRLKNPDQPWRDFNRISGYMTNTMNQLSKEQGDMWNSSDISDSVKKSAVGCLGAGAIVGTVAGVGGFGVLGFKVGSVATAGTCEAVDLWFNKHMGDESVKNYLKTLTRSVYTIYYTDHYVAYLNCIKTDSNTPPEIKSVIEHQLDNLKSQWRALTQMQEEGLNVASQTNDFWGTIYASFMSIITNIMKTAMIWIWSLVSSAPL